MKFTPAPLDDCYIIESNIFRDERGIFFEHFRKEELEHSLGIKMNFVQDNVSVSNLNVLRGLHFQIGEHAQTKLVSVLSGAVLDVVVDLRPGSKSFGQHFSIELNQTNRLSLLIPKGFAHGFLTLEDQTVFYYKCDNYYHPEAESGIYYNDPELAINWGRKEAELIISERDKKLPRLNIS